MVHAVVCRTVTIGADAGHVMVMADLSGTAVVLITDDLLTVLTEQAVHIVGTVERFVEPVEMLYAWGRDNADALDQLKTRPTSRRAD